MQQDVYLIYDIGKTNKKCFVFSINGEVVDEYTEQFEEIEDEDGFVCDDINKIKEWVIGQYKLLCNNLLYNIVGINFATYGASFVHLDEEGNVLTPLYNYLKHFPSNVEELFFNTHFNSNKDTFALQTASPYMGMLNSGLQLYWLKQSQPTVWAKVKYSLHLPQYLSYLFSNNFFSDYTSIGCHTGIWNFEKKQYHQWVLDEKINEKLAPINTEKFNFNDKNILIGTGLHDSSSALIPYLKNNTQPFILLSTGTWCISLNPFNNSKLTAEQLSLDCLQYLQADGNTVYASRLFFGKEHDFQTNRIATHFNVENNFYFTTKYIRLDEKNTFTPSCMEGCGPMPQKFEQNWNFEVYTNAHEAYNALIMGLMNILKTSINLIDNQITQIYIDGGFAKNEVFIQNLELFYPNKKIDIVAFPQATALGAFLAIQK